MHSTSQWLKADAGKVLVAGPCSAESAKQMLDTARGIAAKFPNAILRAGSWKPRTRPGNFEGSGVDGLNWLKDAGNPEKAVFLQGFFKTGPGEYGEGDLFLGVTVPQQRLIAKTLAPQATLPLLSELLQHPYHEMRLTGLLALVYRFEKTSY